MSVCCMAMVDASSSGVMQTTDPMDRSGNRCLLNSLWGLGRDIVQGSVPPDIFAVDKTDGKIIERKIARKEMLVSMNPDSGVEEIDVPPEKQNEPSISESMIAELVESALKLENHYGEPQDVEWAVDENDKLYILQTRPIGVYRDDDTGDEEKPREIEVDADLLFQGGDIAYRGVAHGPVFVLKNDADLSKVPNGCILVTHRASPKIVSVMTRTKGIITDVGSSTGHMSTLAREFMIPTVVNTGNARDVLMTGMYVTLDSHNRKVYEGRIAELINDTKSSRKGFFTETPVYGVLERALEHISTLNLVDPESPDFKSENCKTLHDIVRFSHQKAMSCMLTLAEDAARTAKIGTKLKADIPLDVYILDLGGGLCELPDGDLIPEDKICSVPMRAFWEGLTEMKWPNPKPVINNGAKPVVAGTIADPKLKQRLKEKTLAITTDSYMNFSLHLGYHLATVEALLASNPRDSYARLYFQGGGATQERRVRRADLVNRILEFYGFEVNMQVDLINAIYSGCGKEELESIMKMLGHLTVYTKQLDMVMYNDAIVDWFVEEFLKGNYN